MAFGKFIKKIFSFGKKKVEEEVVETEEQVAIEAPIPEPAAEPEPPAPEPEPEPEPATVEVEEPVAEPAPKKKKPAPKPKKPKAKKAPKPVETKTDEPAPVEETVKAEQVEAPEPFDAEAVLAHVNTLPKSEANAYVDALLPEQQEQYLEAWQKASDAEFERLTAEMADNPVTQEEAAALEEAEPWVEPEDGIESILDEQIADIEQGIEKLKSDAPDEDDVDAEPDVEAEPTEPPSEPDVATEQKIVEPIRNESRGSVTIGDQEQVETQPEPEPEPEKKSWLKRLTSGLSRSSKQLTENITSIFTKRKLDEDTLQDLEDVLIQADLGIETAMRITDSLSSGRYGKDVSTDEVRQVMGEEITKVLDPVAMPLELDLSYKPHVILVVGVNGTGKTTTIGKLAAKLRDAGLKVTLGAGDTFRAAAIEQLKIWADRTGSEFVATKLGSDAAGLAYGAYETARDNGSDVVIIDTAGRLQNKTELMDELAKIVRVLQKHDPDAPHTVLQTLDATTGQNALSQVEIFRNIAGVNGLVMTKLDGTARGGILVAIAAKFKLPVFFIGVGEQVDDLEPFSADEFAKAIVGDASVEEEA